MLQKLPASHWDLKKLRLVMQLGEMKQETLGKLMTDQLHEQGISQLVNFPRSWTASGVSTFPFTPSAQLFPPGAQPLSQPDPSLLSRGDRVIGKQVNPSKPILFAVLFLPEAGLSMAGVAQESQ